MSTNIDELRSCIENARRIYDLDDHGLASLAGVSEEVLIKAIKGFSISTEIYNKIINNLRKDHNENHIIDDDNLKSLKIFEQTLALKEPTEIFIDGANFYNSTVRLNLVIDYMKLFTYFHENTNLIRIRYYTAVDRKFDTPNHMVRLLDWMDNNGYTVIRKTFVEFTDEDGNLRRKGNLDIEMVTDMIESSHNGIMKHAVIFTGDGDFVYPINRLKSRGIKVSVVSLDPKSEKDDSIPITNKRLKIAADRFVDLAAIGDRFERKN